MVSKRIVFGLLVSMLSSSAFAGNGNTVTDDPYGPADTALQAAGVKVKGSGGDVILPYGFICDPERVYCSSTYFETYHGLVVRNGDLNVVTRNGESFAITGYTDPLSLSVKPKLTAEQAIAIARQGGPAQVLATDAELVVLRGHNKFQALVWEVNFEVHADPANFNAPRHSQIVNVDARSGAVISRFHGVHQYVMRPGSPSSALRIEASEDCFDGPENSALQYGELASHYYSHVYSFYPTGEAAALAEAATDVDMILSQFWRCGEYGQCDYKPDWLVGEDLFGGGSKAVRYAFDPTLDTVSPRCYSSDVPLLASVSPAHAAGIPERFMYLLTEGTAPKVYDGVTHYAPTCNGASFAGLGYKKSLRIWNDALAWYMADDANFADARRGTIFAAIQNYGEGSPEVAAVIAAWDAVNVH